MYSSTSLERPPHKNVVQVVLGDRISYIEM